VRETQTETQRESERQSERETEKIGIERYTERESERERETKSRENGVIDDKYTRYVSVYASAQERDKQEGEDTCLLHLRMKIKSERCENTHLLE